MKKLIYALLPLLFSFLCISAQSESIHDTTAVEIGQRIGAKNKDYYFQPGSQLLTELYSYEVKERNASKSVSDNPFRSRQGPQEAYLVGKLNTGEKLILSKLLEPCNTDAINLESDTTYQITFSGSLRFKSTVFKSGHSNGNPGKSYTVIDVEFCGTDTITLRPNETNIIEVDIGNSTANAAIPKNPPTPPLTATPNLCQ